jgi:hypothetical protein
MPITHVLAVPDRGHGDAVSPWQTTYVKAFEKEWGLQLPKVLLDVLSGMVL